MINIETFPKLILSYHVGGRNGYYGIDEYLNEDGDRFSGCTRMVESFPTKKKAVAVCGYMNELAHEINKLRGNIE